MRKLAVFVFPLTASFVQPAGAQTTAQIAARVDSLRAEVAEVRAMFGAQFLGKSSEELKAALIPANTLPGGRYPYMLSDYQLHVAVDALVAAKTLAPATTNAPAPVVSVPAAPTIPGLSAQQISDVVQCLTDGVNGGYPIAGTRDRVKSELAAGVYSYGVRSVIDDAKLWYYSGQAGANRSALYSYLVIIDQRDPANPNETLSAGDPRWKRVGSPQAVAAPAQFANSVSGDLYVSGRIIVGSCVHTDGNALVHVCGSGDGAIQFESGVGGSKPAVGMLSLGGDHGLRLLQNAYTSVNTHPAYDPVGNVNYQSNLIESVDPNYPQGIFGGDSQARWSWNVKAPGLGHDYTQDIAIGINEATKQITFESWRPGWTFQFVTSSGFRSIDRRFTVPTQ